MRALRWSLPLLFVTACTPAIPTGQSSSPIIGGTTDTGDPGVVMLRAIPAGGGNQGFSICTAEVVSPHVIMTAAHCVAPSEVGSGATFDVFIGSDMNSAEGNDPSKYLAVAETHYNPGFDPNQLDNGQDVSVVILKNPTSIKPIPMNRTALTQSSIGKTLRLVGYGVSSGSDQYGQTAGTKRQVSTPLTDYDSLFITFGTSSKDTCQGDSGGPALITINGTEVIAGITSFGYQGCGGGATDTRVDTVGVAFVDPYIQKFDPNGSGGGGGTNGGPVDMGGGSTGSGGGDDGGVGGGGASDDGGTDPGNGNGNGNGNGSGQTGATCAGPDDCASGLCLALNSAKNICTTSCTPGAAGACPANYECKAVSGQNICVPGVINLDGNGSSGGGCSMSGEAAPGGWLALLLCVSVIGVLAMRRRRATALLVFSGALYAVVLAGCGADSSGRTRGPTTSGDNGGSGSGSGSGTGTGGGGGASGCSGSNQTADEDHDGYTIAQGDCNDCDPLVNPGAVEVAGNSVDDDCNGTADDPPPSCDTSGTANDATALAQAFEQCDPRFFLGAQLVGPSDGKARARTPKFGVVVPKAGATMALLSTGIAVDKMGSGFVEPQIGSTLGASNQYANPQPNLPGIAGCSQTQPDMVNDYTELVVKLKAPTNASSFTFQFQFFSAEYPEFVCTEFNDEFLVLQESKGEFSTPTNISFDSKMNPITVNNGLFTVCQNSNAKAQTQNCMKPMSEIAQTGYDDMDDGGIFGTGAKEPMGGSTGWLTTTSPVTPGEEVTLHFIIFDEGDHIYDSAVLIDNFQWSLTAADAPTTIN